MQDLERRYDLQFYLNFFISAYISMTRATTAMTHMTMMMISMSSFGIRLLVGPGVLVFVVYMVSIVAASVSEVD